MLKSTLVTLFLAFALSCGLHLPSQFEKCKRSDAKLNDCLQRAIQGALPVLANGLPEFNFPKIEPVEIPSMSVGEGKGAVHVVQNYKNVKIYNLYKSTVNNVKSSINDDTFELSLDAFLDDSTMEAEYDLKGSILILPIVGNGTCTIRLKNVKVTFHLTGEVFTKKEKRYLQIMEFDVKMFPGKVEFDFRNLFNGDAKLGNEMNKLLNDNWKDVFVDVQSGYEETLGAIFKGMANLIFKKIPYVEIFLP